MEPNTETIDYIDDIDTEITKHRDTLEIMINNSSFESKQIKSLRRFVADEENRLKAKIKYFQEYNLDYKSLASSEFALFQRNIANFILLLE